MLIVVAGAGAASAQDAGSRAAVIEQVQAAEADDVTTAAPDPAAPAAGVEQAESGEAEPSAQAADPSSRAALIEQAQTVKSEHLTPAMQGKAEQQVTRLLDIFLSGQLHWHPFWQSAYSGGGFTLGAGYSTFVSPSNLLDVRGSYTFSGYKRMEAEFLAPELFKRRGTLSVLGGWREATQVGFYGFGMTSSQDHRTNYSFTQPYLSAQLEVFPMRRLFVVRGGIEATQWKQNPGEGTDPSVETAYTSATLPGLGAQPFYWHSQGTVGFESRAARGYARRGAFYGVTVHDFTEQDKLYGFTQVDYEAIQHIPILRDTWVVSLHGLAQTTYDKSGQQIPFFMMPSLGGGSDLRAYASWRLRDLNSLLLQAEWRVIASRFIDMALFYDAGTVSARRNDLDLHDMKTDIGLGFRLHGAAATPLRIEFTQGSEGFGIVLAASHAF